MYDLTGKVAIITGGASGMGRAASILFARHGANVVLADLNAASGDEVAQLASESGNKALFQRTDVSQEADVAALVARAVKEFGRLDIIFNNAGIGGAVGPLEGISVEDWDRTQAVCLRGVFLGMKYAVKPMREAGGGSIISTASIAGIDGYPNLHAYSAAKAGVVNLTRSAALEFACDRIRVNCIAPGGISTPILYGFAGRQQGCGGGNARAGTAVSTRGSAGRHRERRAVSRERCVGVHHRPHVGGGWRCDRGADCLGAEAGTEPGAAGAHICGAVIRAVTHCTSLDRASEPNRKGPARHAPLPLRSRSATGFEVAPAAENRSTRPRSTLHWPRRDRLDDSIAPSASTATRTLQARQTGRVSPAADRCSRHPPSCSPTARVP